jgi:regulator of sirC expression with transglutaminase-like and TPR domain
MNIPNFDQTPSALDYFAALVSSDEHFPLLEAAASIALIDEPELDVESVLEEVERMVERVRSRMISSADDLTRLAVLNHVFYKDMGFGLNANDYYAPRNSFVNEVLRTRRGIPVSLSVIWLEMAQELGLRAHGIAFPGHFLVKVALDSGLVVLDPATGESLGIDHLSERLEPFRDQEDQLLKPDLDEGETPLGLYLQSCPPRDVLTRMLRNLKEIYQTQQDWSACLAVLDRILALWPEAWAERRDRGLVHAELGNAGQALSDLQAYLDAEPLAADQGALQARIKEIASPLSGSQ